MTSTPNVTRISKLGSFELAPGVMAQPLFGQHVMLNFLRFAPGAVISRHHHPHEQVGLILEGGLQLSTDAGQCELTDGGLFVVPPDAPHAGVASSEGCFAVDVFYPIREDYRERWQREFGEGR